jgi:hypothetical protein
MTRVRILAALVNAACQPLAKAADWLDAHYAGAINRPEDEA